MYKRLAGQRREAFPLPASSAYLPEWPAAAPDRGGAGSAQAPAPALAGKQRGLSGTRKPSSELSGPTLSPTGSLSIVLIRSYFTFISPKKVKSTASRGEISVLRSILAASFFRIEQSLGRAGEPPTSPARPAAGVRPGTAVTDGGAACPRAQPSGRSPRGRARGGGARAALAMCRAPRPSPAPSYLISSSSFLGLLRFSRPAQGRASQTSTPFSNLS